MNSLTWLHLSDLHFSKALAYDRKRVIETLLSDIKRNSRFYQPDLLFFTGDLAFGEINNEKIADQFDLGFEFLSKVRKSFDREIPIEHCFLVPGNHDVQRSLTTDDQKTHLAKCTDKEIHSLIVKRDLTWKRIVERLDEYAFALQRHGYGHLLQDRERLIYAKRLELRGMKIGIGGFNSAWSCQGDGEHGQVRMGSLWQMQHIDSELSGTDFRFALIHHPFEWLHEHEGPSARLREFSRRFSVILHGHEHEDWVTQISKGHFIVAAAAGYDNSKLKNGYNFGTLCNSKRSIRFTFQRYDPQGEDWIANVIANHSDSMGRIKFRLPQMPFTPKATDVVMTTPKKDASSLSEGQEHIAVSVLSEPTHIPPRYDIFFAVAMAAVKPQTYKWHRNSSLQVFEALRKYCEVSSVYCPLEQVAERKNFDPADVALRRGLEAVGNCKLFVMLYREASPSSILVEAGFALARNIPSIYFVHSSVELPFLLLAANQALPALVRVYKFQNVSDIIKLLKEEGPRMYREMTRTRP